jgi:hypothetical protein
MLALGFKHTLAWQHSKRPKPAAAPNHASHIPAAATVAVRRCEAEVHRRVTVVVQCHGLVDCIAQPAWREVYAAAAAE